MAPQIATSRPPAEFVEVESWQLDSTAELSGLRASLYRAMTGDTAPAVPGLPDVPEKMVLVASELATNALRYGAPPTTVKLSSAEDEYLLDVADRAPARPPVVEPDRPPGEGGLGLQLAQHLSLDVGWYATDVAKHVWATFPWATPAPSSPTATARGA